ncbi:MAG TPA: O-antigen ligase family protein, partial [Gammaproteobacteria bacterium]|nr:O-antigen ligase family protein [Gammaproteobacteria bacterium]
MTTIALPRFSIRGYLAILAHVLGIVFAIAIPLSNSVTTVISLGLAVLCAACMDTSTWSKVFKHPITIAIVIFISLNILGTFYSAAGAKAISLALRKILRLLYFPLLLTLFTQAKWRNYANIGFLAAIVVSVIAAIINGWAFFKDTIFTSLFVAYAIFMLAHYAFDYKQYRKITIPLAVFFTFYLMFIGTGRAGQVLFVMFFLLFMYQRLDRTIKQQGSALLLLTVILAGSILTPSSFVMRQAEAIAQIKQYSGDEEDIDKSSMGTRLLLAQNSWELIKAKPVFGWGTGSFRSAYADNALEQQTTKLRTNPHNQYLLTWVELGLPGLIALLYVFFSA